jgi:hypothetical protein
MLFMLRDMDDGGGRAMQLATHLFALRACLEQLPNLQLVISSRRCSMH